MQYRQNIFIGSIYFSFMLLLQRQFFFLNICFPALLSCSTLFILQDSPPVGSLPRSIPGEQRAFSMCVYRFLSMALSGTCNTSVVINVHIFAYVNMSLSIVTLVFIILVSQIKIIKAAIVLQNMHVLQSICKNT